MTLTRAKFLAWLREQKPGRRFKRRDAYACPLARFTRRRMGGILYKSRPLPKWAKRFIWKVDCEFGKTITAAECIKILEPSGACTAVSSFRSA